MSHARPATSPSQRRRPFVAVTACTGSEANSSCISAPSAVAVARCRMSQPTVLGGSIRRRTTRSPCLPTRFFALRVRGLLDWGYGGDWRLPPLAELSPLMPGRLLDVGSGRGDLGLV